MVIPSEEIRVLPRWESRTVHGILAGIRISCCNSLAARSRGRNFLVSRNVLAHSVLIAVPHLGDGRRMAANEILSAWVVSLAAWALCTPCLSIVAFTSIVHGHAARLS